MPEPGFHLDAHRGKRSFRNNSGNAIAFWFRRGNAHGDQPGGQRRGDHGAVYRKRGPVSVHRRNLLRSDDNQWSACRSYPRGDFNQNGQILLNSPSYPSTVYLASSVPPPTPPPAGAVVVTINANTASQVFTVTGTGCAPGWRWRVPQTLQWAPGASCTVAFVSPYSQQAGIQYLLTGWQDGSTSNPRVIVTPAQPTTCHRASFKTPKSQLIVTCQPSYRRDRVSGGGFVDAGGTAICDSCVGSRVPVCELVGVASGNNVGEPDFRVGELFPNDHRQLPTGGRMPSPGTAR